jgi:hypothetical protein
MSKKKLKIIIQPKKLINFYELEETQKHIKKYHNPSYDNQNMPLKHPLRMLICGSSGAGKTNVLLNIIMLMENTFNGIRVFTKNSDEPLYNLLREKIPQLQIYDGLDELNNMDLEDEFFGQELLIFDDLVLEKNQKQIEQLFIRGRKLSDGEGLSLIYLTQIYHKTPREIRLQCDNLIIKKCGSNMDIKRILGDKDMGSLKPKELLNMFDYSVDTDITNFLFIDLKATMREMFRKNFDEILDVQNFKIN